MPHYFLEETIGRDAPPPIAHPEYFYGFVGVALAWQIAFVLVSRDPVRYRPLMLVAVVEKASFGLAAVALYLNGRLSGQMFAAGLLDLILGALFIAAYIGTPAAGKISYEGRC